MFLTHKVLYLFSIRALYKILQKNKNKIKINKNNKLINLRKERVYLNLKFWMNGDNFLKIYQMQIQDLEL